MSSDNQSIIPIDTFNNKNQKHQLQESQKEIDPMEWAEIYGHENFLKRKDSSIK